MGLFRKKSLREKEREIRREEIYWNAEKSLLEREQKLRDEKREMRKPKKMSTTKLLVGFLFINCTLVELFTGWATAQSLKISYMTGNPMDFSPLVTLIGAVVTEVMGFAVYAVKATKENTANGITYMMAQQSFNNNNDPIEEEPEEDNSSEEAQG
jgi:hypothetical protein